jgi:hypothetical protein
MPTRSVDRDQGAVQDDVGLVLRGLHRGGQAGRVRRQQVDDLGDVPPDRAVGGRSSARVLCMAAERTVGHAVRVHEGTTELQNPQVSLRRTRWSEFQDEPQRGFHAS